MRFAIYVAVALVALPAAAWAQTTGFKTGEQSTGMTKQCYYQALGNNYTRTLSSVQLCPLTIQVPSTMGNSNAGYSRPQSNPSSVTGFKTGERTTGMTKQCFYSALGNQYTKTISSIGLCPLSVQVQTGG